MKRLMIGAVALTALAATPALATAPSTEFQVQGSVSAACFATGGTIDFGSMSINGSTGRLAPGQNASSTGSDAWCNGVNSTLSFTSTGKLTNLKTTDDTAFTSELSFTPSVTLGGNDVASGTKIGAAYGSLVVKADGLSDGGKLPVAGDYTGLISVTLSPAV